MSVAGKTSSRSSRWPTGHVVWAFTGLPQYEGLVASFLAEGMAFGERMICVSDAPNPRSWPSEPLALGELLIVSTFELYGDTGGADIESRLSTFTAVLGEALRDGYSGIRVAADNSSMVDGAKRLQDWLQWEKEAERFITVNGITGMCAFDRTRLEAASLRILLGAHHTSCQVP